MAITMVLILLYMFAIATVSSYGNPRDVPDFQHNAEIQRLGHFAVEEYNKQQHGDLSFSKVVRAQEQVVSGMMYYITIQAVGGGRSGLYDAKILVVAWRNLTQLQEFKPSQSPRKDTIQASGWHTVSTEDPLVKEAALNAVRLIHQRSNSLLPYELQNILSAKEQEMNGVKNFNLLLKIKRGNKMESYEVEMKRSPDGKWTMKI